MLIEKRKNELSMGMVVDRQTYSLSNLEAGISST